MNYRFHPIKGLRQQGKPYGLIDTDFAEIDEESFMMRGMTKDEARQEFSEAIRALSYKVMNEEDEGEDASD